MSEMNEIKNYLMKLGASKVGFADVNGLASEFIDLPNGISLVLKLPKETIEYLYEEDYEAYWKSFHYQIGQLTKISHKGERYIKDLGYNAFALTMKRNECDMKKLLSILPYKTIRPLPPNQGLDGLEGPHYLLHPNMGLQLPLEPS